MMMLFFAKRKQGLKVNSNKTIFKEFRNLNSPFKRKTIVFISFERYDYVGFDHILDDESS